jgi:uncharacterized phosphosugar-binding protein
VVAVTSVAQSMARPPDHPTGTRLLDHADVVIDLCTPAGDALVTLGGLDTPIGPGSTVANAAIVNEIKVQTAERLLAAGVLPPVLTSSAVVGPERSAALFEAAYREHARRVSRVLAGADATAPEGPPPDGD